MTVLPAPASPLAAFRGPVTCRCSAGGLILRGAAADSADEILILTFICSVPAGLPDLLGTVSVSALDERHYRIASESGEWTFAATSVHVHRDIGAAFRRAIPPRHVPIGKRIFWRMVMTLAGSRTGKRLLLAVRGR